MLLEAKGLGNVARHYQKRVRLLLLLEVMQLDGGLLSVSTNVREKTLWEDRLSCNHNNKTRKDEEDDREEEKRGGAG